MSGAPASNPSFFPLSCADSLTWITFSPSVGTWSLILKLISAVNGCFHGHVIDLYKTKNKRNLAYKSLQLKLLWTCWVVLSSIVWRSASLFTPFTLVCFFFLVDVERHARDFMEAAKKLQLYFIGLQHEDQPSKEEMLRKVLFLRRNAQINHSNYLVLKTESLLPISSCHLILSLPCFRRSLLWKKSWRSKVSLSQSMRNSFKVGEKSSKTSWRNIRMS